MNKRLLLVSIFIITDVILFSLETIYVAPFYHIDEVNDEVHPDNDYHKMLIHKMQNKRTGLNITFSKIPVDQGLNPPKSIADAIKVCQNEHADYLLYGYMAFRDYTIYAELKILDYEKRGIIKIIYSVDDLKNIDRLMEDLATKIIAFLEETFNVGFYKDMQKYSEWWSYVNFGYWTPVENEWLNLLIGTGMVDFGIVFFPTDRICVWGTYPVNLSLGLELSYQFGLGFPERYKAYDHIIAIGLPFRLHLIMNDIHDISSGIALFYRLDLLQFQDAYEDSKLLPYTSLGASFLFGYSIRIREFFAISADNRFDFLFNYDKAFISYSLRLGLNFRLSKKELKKKW